MPDLKIIAYLHSDFSAKFGIPRQSNLAPGTEATVVFEPDYRSPEAVRGLENFSHIWLLWGFSKTEGEGWSPTVRPPRLGGNARVGVFATRSPYRPNAIGLSSVRLAGIRQHQTRGPVLHVLGADLLDGTPVYDIKPYLPYTDSHPAANGGFADAPPERLEVFIEDKWMAMVPLSRRQALAEILAQDPRPSYQNDVSRIYGMAYAGLEIKFSVSGKQLRVHSVTAESAQVFTE